MSKAGCNQEGFVDLSPEAVHGVADPYTMKRHSVCNGLGSAVSTSGRLVGVEVDHQRPSGTSPSSSISIR